MRILLSTIHYPVAASRYVYWALKRMGHEVITVGPAVGPFLPWANGTNLEPYEWKPDIAMGPSEYGQHNASPLKDALALLHTPPDLIIQMDAHFVMGGKAPCPNVLWAIDNHLERYGAYDTFDRIFIAHSWGYMHELPNAEWLPCAHDPLHHFVIDESAPRPYDVMVIGVGYPQREAVVAALRGAGIKVLASTGKIYSEYNRLYNQAKIALVVSSQHDLAMRVFENMAQGCLVVADEEPDMAKAGFEDGVHYLQYRTLSEAVATVGDALKYHGSARIDEIAMRAREAVKPHTWQSRIERILEAAS